MYFLIFNNFIGNPQGKFCSHSLKFSVSFKTFFLINRITDQTVNVMVHSIEMKKNSGNKKNYIMARNRLKKGK